MITSPIAYFHPADYETIKRFFPNDPNYPHAYNEWFYLARKHLLEEQSRGHSIQEVIVNANDFARFCYRTGRERDNAALNAFLVEEVPRQIEHRSPFLLRDKSSGPDPGG